MQPEQPNPIAHLPGMLDDARAYNIARLNYSPTSYVSPEARERHIDDDAHSTMLEARFALAWNLGYARGIAEGRRQATEGWEREWGSQWMPKLTAPVETDVAIADDEEEARRNAEEWLDHRAVSRLVGPWEPAEQPEDARPSIPRCSKCSAALAPCSNCATRSAQCGEPFCVECTPDEAPEPTRTWAPGQSPAEKLASLHRQPHGSRCTCRECDERYEGGA